MEEIRKKIDEYGKLKQEESQLKKRTDKLNTEIKTYMGHHDLDKFEAEDFIANYTLRKKDDFDDDKLIALFKESLKDMAYQLGIIKTREIIDMDAIEKAAYDGILDEEVLLSMDTCKITKHTPYLTIVKKGEK